MDDDDDDDDVNVNLLNDIKDKILLDDLDYIKLTLKNSATNSNIIDVTDISNILDEGDINNLLFYSISMKRLKIFEYFYNEHLYYKDDFYTFNEIYFLLIKENELSLFEYFLNNKIFIENENQINNLKIFLLKNFKIEVNLNFKSFFEIFIKYVEIKHKDYEELIFTLFIKNLNYCGSIEERLESRIEFITYILNNYYNISNLQNLYKELMKCISFNSFSIKSYLLLKNNGYIFSEEKEISYIIDLFATYIENNGFNDKYNFLTYLIENEFFDFYKLKYENNKNIYHFIFENKCYNLIPLLKESNFKIKDLDLKNNDNYLLYSLIKNYKFNQLNYEIISEFINNIDQIPDVNYILRYLTDIYVSYHDNLFMINENDYYNNTNNTYNLTFNNYNYYHKTLLLFINKYDNIDYDILLILNSTHNFNFKFFKFLIEKGADISKVKKFLFLFIMSSHKDSLYNIPYYKYKKSNNITRKMINNYYIKVYSYLINNGVDVEFYETFYKDELDDPDYEIFLNIKILNNNIEDNNSEDMKKWIKFNSFTLSNNDTCYIKTVDAYSLKKDLYIMNYISIIYYKSKLIKKEKKIFFLLKLFFNFFWSEIDIFKFFIKKGMSIYLDQVPKNHEYYKKPVEYFFKYLMISFNSFHSQNSIYSDNYNDIIEQSRNDISNYIYFILNIYDNHNINFNKKIVLMEITRKITLITNLNKFYFNSKILIFNNMFSRLFLNLFDKLIKEKDINDYNEYILLSESKHINKINNINDIKRHLKFNESYCLTYFINSSLFTFSEKEKYLKKFIKNNIYFNKNEVLYHLIDIKLNNYYVTKEYYPISNDEINYIDCYSEDEKKNFLEKVKKNKNFEKKYINLLKFLISNGANINCMIKEIKIDFFLKNTNFSKDEIDIVNNSEKKIHDTALLTNTKFIIEFLIYNNDYIINNIDDTIHNLIKFNYNDLTSFVLRKNISKVKNKDSLLKEIILSNNIKLIEVLINDQISFDFVKDMELKDISNEVYKLLRSKKRKTPYFNYRDNDICPISQEKFKRKDLKKMCINCKNVFSKENIDEWLAIENKCPMCRSDANFYDI